MCKIMIGEWSRLKSTVAADMLKGAFPKCGVKYTKKYGHGLVLVMDGVPLDIVRDKAKAAGMDSYMSVVFKVPNRIAAVYGHIPTLTEVA